MRDAFGGAFTIKLILIFLTIYISFIAVALNYAKAFRVKNKIIDIIEQNEGINDFNDTSGIIGNINTYLISIGYNVNIEDSDEENTHCRKLGYCIQVNNASPNGTYYKVTTYVKIDLPFFGIHITIPINGETRKILVDGLVK